jgi:hypothetical protein
MTVQEAKELVLKLMLGYSNSGISTIAVNPNSPDPSDPGKFSINGKPARVIHHFSGWHVPIDLEWFRGGYNQPRINRGHFFWYVFAIPDFGRYQQPHYFICDYLQMREWVLEFSAPMGRNHQDHSDWLANIHIYRKLGGETQAYFRWGDEPLGFSPLTSRVIMLDNLGTVSERPDHIGTYAPGGESEAHRRLKLYVAENPSVIGLRPTAQSTIEYSFRTGDRVDILFENHSPLRSVAEIELQGEENICTGIHQAIKYRVLAEADEGYPLLGSETRAIVVAFDTSYFRAEELAKKYDVSLVPVDRRTVLSFD